MMIFYYKTKKQLKENIGKNLDFSETSIFGSEYDPNGRNVGTNHPKRSWFAEVFLKNGIIEKVK